MQHTAHMGYGYTQIWSLIGFAHGQMYIGSETHSYCHADDCHTLRNPNNHRKYYRPQHLHFGLR